MKIFDNVNDYLQEAKSGDRILLGQEIHTATFRSQAFNVVGTKQDGSIELKHCNNKCNKVIKPSDFAKKVGVLQMYDWQRLKK